MVLMVCQAEKAKTRILKAGKLSKASPNAGFTLMELIVVLVIISIMLVFTVPEFSQRIFRDNTETTLNWIVFNVSKLKKEAGYQGKDLFMCISPDTNTISIRANPPDPESLDSKIISNFSLPEDVILHGVEFNMPGQKTNNDSCIQFYKKRYSDHAIIHISDNHGNFFSCLIQPFLHKVKIYEKYIQF
jgi:prepilin-type N-terminal cleavage/methylation domain-containing protein